ncbi:unnamed protein product, partial [Ectocarpus fasciculatus]
LALLIECEALRHRPSVQRTLYRRFPVAASIMRSRGAGLLVLLCPELFLHTHDQRTDVAALQFPSSITTRLRANRIVGRRTASPAAGSSSSSSAASSSSPRGGRSKSSASPSADRVRLLRDARILLMPPLGGKAVVESGLADAIVQ